MAIKAIEMVRKIRDKHYEETTELSVEEQIKLVKDKARRLQGTLVKKQQSTVDGRAPTST
jgi:hypothetical protein